MSADWLAEAPGFLVAVLLLTIPGLPAALLLRLRGILLVGGSVAVSLAIVGAASVVTPIFGASWSLVPVVIASAFVTLVAALLWASRRDRAIPIRGADTRGVWLGIGGALLGWALVVLLGIRSAGHPSQLYDGLFHLNAVQFVMQTGDASPFHMTMVMDGIESTFYPTLWHAVVSLVAPFASGVVAATNVVSIVVIAVVWPVALASLAAVLFPRHRAAATWAPLVAFGFAVFPLGFLNWGVLYPNLLGMAQTPLVVAFVVIIGRFGAAWPQHVGVALVAVAALGSTALAHPSALLGAVALLVPYGVSRAWRWARGLGGGGRAGVVLLSLAILGALVVLWAKANVTTHEWLPMMTMAQAAGEIAFLSPVGRTAGLVIGPLAVVGIVTVIRARQWWIVASHAVAAAFFLVSAWWPILPLRSAVVGPWYDDTTRVAALLAVFGLPLAALGAAVTVDALRALRRRGHARRALAAVVAVSLLASTHLVAVYNDIRTMRDVSFRFDAQSQGLSPDEARLFEKADAVLDEDDRVLGNPLTGAALLFAYTGHAVVFPHVTGRYSDAAERLARSLNDGDAASMCPLLEEEGVTHVIDFGDRELFENHFTTYSGLQFLSDVPFLTEVTRSGDAALYEVTGC